MVGESNTGESGTDNLVKCENKNNGPENLTDWRGIGSVNKSWNGDNGTRTGFIRKTGKSVTLIDNIKTNDDEFKFNGYIKRNNCKTQKDNNCLRSILKPWTNNTSDTTDGCTSSAKTLTEMAAATATATTTRNDTQLISPQTNCPSYFGIKSYIDSFYYPPDTEVLNSDEFIQDDFEFVVEPGKRRWRNCWFKVGLWFGINLLLLGIIALLVGHLTPPREPIVARVDSVQVLDRSAMSFNFKLYLCQLSGITIFCVGGIVLMLTLLVSSYDHDTPSYYIMNTSEAGFPSTEKTFTRIQQGNKAWTCRIPLTGMLEKVQPR